MSSDAGEREPRPSRPDLDLPEVTAVRARRTSFRPRRRNYESGLPSLDETVEIAVETAAPIPARALGPVLHVGTSTLTEVTADDETHYRFVALRPEELESGAAISLGWSGQPLEESRPTGRRFEAPGDVVGLA